MVQVAILIF